MRILCGRACVLLAGGMTCDQAYLVLKIENISYFESRFREYNGTSPEEYRSWAVSL